MIGLVILGIILLIIGFTSASVNPNLRRFATLFRIGGVIVILIGLLAAGIKQIESGTIGVKKLFGKVQDDALPEGLQFVNPLIEVIRFDIKTQNYTMSGVNDEGDKQGDDAIRVLSADGLEVTIDLTVLYRLMPNETPRILRELGTDYRNVVVRPITRTKIRDNAVYYSAVDLYSVKRDEFQNKIFESIKKDFETRGLFLEQLLVRNITLPASVRTTIESKINAEQEAQKMQFVLQKEQQEAERKRVEAKGIADYQNIINSSLTDKQLQYENIKAMQELVKSPNSKIIFMGGGKANASVMVGN
jgi:regulator of protease activity HflC (stomatin/prohibitin superfamily)